MAQDYDKISEAFSSANVSAISSMFDAQVDMAVNGEEEAMDKPEAEKALRNFFTAHSPRSFSMVHKGVSPNDVHYLIGTLNTSTGEFRTTIYLHKAGDKFVIQSLEIEE